MTGLNECQVMIVGDVEHSLNHNPVSCHNDHLADNYNLNSSGYKVRVSARTFTVVLCLYVRFSKNGRKSGHGVCISAHPLKACKTITSISGHQAR